MGGCVRGVARIGCLVVLVALAAGAYIYREQVVAVYRGVRGLPPPAKGEYVAASPDGARRAEAALERLTRRGGPAFVDLGAADLAALVEAALARTPPRVFDSVRVGLLENEIRVRGSLDVSGVPRNVLGPLSGAIGPREPVEIGGPLRADSAGRLLWRVTALSVRDFPFPRSTIPSLMRQLRVPGVENGEMPLPGLARVGDVRVTPGSVRLYRATPR